MSKVFCLNGGIKCKDNRQLDKEEIVAEVIDELQKYVQQADAVANDTEKTAQEKLERLEWISSAFSAVSNCLTFTIGIEARLPDGEFVGSKLFGRIFYLRQMAEIDASKETDKE